MKLLTCNTHSLVEERYEEKLKAFVERVAEERFDVIALQEVNQTHGGVIVEIKEQEYLVTKEELGITSDNHVLSLVKMLQEKGIHYYWTWTPIKLGYGRYDEGIAILSLNKPEEVNHFYISASENYDDWHCRKVIGVKTKGCWFYSMHMGWWQEETESFRHQWEKFLANLSENDKIYLMGDFNNPAHANEEGYDLVLDSGFYDTYHLAGQKDEGVTVVKAIDGWHDKGVVDKMRIDFIFKNNDTEVESSHVIFNGDNGPVISDHFGVVINDEGV